MDDKALITSLLNQQSTRVQLVEFKEARAEIWKIFRLCYLDGKPMPYAVCIKCLKAGKEDLKNSAIFKNAF